MLRDTPRTVRGMTRGKTSSDKEFTVEMIFFECPHCLEELKTPAHKMGETLSCPVCDGPVCPVSPKQVVAAGLAVGALSVLGAILFGED